MKNALRRARTLALIALVAGLSVVVVRTALAGPATAPRPVDEVRAERVEIPPGQQLEAPRLDRPEGDWIGGLGLVEPAAPESRLAPAVPGRIAAILVEEGQFVTTGTVLVELESGPEQAALRAAEAEVTVAQAQLARARGGVRPEDLDALRTDAEAAQTRASSSAAVLTRLETAARGGGVTVDEVDRARRQADAERLSALTAVSRARAGQSGRREDVTVAQAQYESSVARREQARAALERLRIVAPIDGEVLEIHYRIGEYVQPGGQEPLVVLGDTRTLRARIDVDERDVARVQPGARALIEVDAFADRRFEGRVVQIGRRMGRKNLRTDEPTERIDTKVLEVVVELGDDARSLLVGQRLMGYIAPGGAAAPAAGTAAPAAP
jgi:HlyD family secretion protein